MSGPRGEAALPRRGGVLRAALALLVVAFVIGLPRGLLEDWQGTEGRRVQVVQEMLQSGDWMVPTLGGEPTFAKPPLHYWMLAASAEVFGDGFLAMRLPAILLLWGLAVLAFVLHQRAFGRATGWVCALGVLCSPMAVTQFAAAEIDPAFACLTAGSLCLLAYAVARADTGLLAAAGVIGGLALMTKGPVYFVFAAGAVLVWWRHRRCRGMLVYLASLMALPVAYFGALLLFRVSWAELTGWASTETVGRLGAYELRHLYELPGFWARAVLVQVPFVLWCFWEFRSTRDARMGPEDLTLRMCSGAAVFAVLLLSVFPGKPTRYLLPNVPLFTFAVAPAVANYAQQTAQLGRFSGGALRILGMLGAVGLLVVPFVPGPIPARAPLLLLLFGLLPLVVRTPRALVAMCIWLPVAAAWTAQLDYFDHWLVGRRARVPHGPLLRAELEELIGKPPTSADLSTWGHMNGPVLLGAGLLPDGHEAALEQPTTRWVLREAERYPPLPPLEGYEQRLRICIPGEVFVVEERVGR